IRDAEEAAVQLAREPLYIAGRWNEAYGEYEPVENLEPFGTMEEAIAAIEANETAVSILVAQGRTRIGRYDIWAVIKALNPDGEHIDDPAFNSPLSLGIA
ncbi:MAG: hypothetical protein QHC89_06030, partial [Bosea sp. (in: a-proteobacteria)]|nr:hypothetical protein [Bosea sp. (in: a-proteobacteria)]